MLANFLSKSKPINFIIIFGLFVLYFFAGMLHHFSGDDFSLSFTLKLIGLLPLFLILFFLFSFIISKNRLTLDNSYALLIFVAIIGISPRTLYDFNQLIFSILLLFFYRYVYSLKRKTPFAEKTFNAGLLLGILFIIEPFSIVFVFLVYSALYFFQQITIRTLLLPLLGAIIAVFFYYCYCFYTDKLQSFSQLFYWYTNYNFEIYYTTSLWIPILIVACITAMAFLVKTSKAFNISGNYRKQAFLLSIHLLISFVFLILLRERNGSELMVTFFPIAIAIANWLETLKSKLLQNSILAFLIGMPFVFCVLLLQDVVVF